MKLVGFEPFLLEMAIRLGWEAAEWGRNRKDEGRRPRAVGSIAIV
jgi:hypothetical protein